MSSNREATIFDSDIDARPAQIEETDPILRNLNPVQMEAVVAGEGPLLILAGAGSGKTRVLTRRIAHLIQRRGVRPERILAVTFTNKAAGEMRERVESMLEFNAGGLWIGTFHSICLRILRRHSERLGFASVPTVFDSDDQVAVLKEVLRENGADSEAPRVRELQSAISSAKNKMWDSDDMREKWNHPDASRIAYLYKEYQTKLRAQSGIDFDDILVLSVRLLERDADLGDAYAEKFSHILVDEYQDTNHVQYRFIKRLAQMHENITVVGDDDQSIYGWRGADISNILDFERTFPQAVTLRMTQNYRSTQAILDVANSVVKRNESRLEKSLWTEKKGGEGVRLVVSLDEDREAEALVARIKERVGRGELKPSEVTLLYRVHAQSRALEEACLRLGLAYIIVGGIAFYQRREVKDVLSYLRLALNPTDAVSLRRAIAAPKRGIGGVSLGRIEQLAAQRGGDLVRACCELGPTSGLKGRALQKAVEFGRLIEELQDRASEGPEPLLRRVVEATDYVAWLKEVEKVSWQEREANVTELQEGAARFAEAIEENSLEAYLDQVTLYTNLDREDLEQDRISMMTVHNAKGLEFHSVYITGLEEGLFPHASSLDDPKEMEEERRLFYVAATRAMNDLTLSASLQRRRMNRFADGGLSRFISEVPESMITVESRHGSTVPELAEAATSWGAQSFGGYRNNYGAGSTPRYGSGSSRERPGRGRVTDRPVDPPSPETEDVIDRGQAPSLNGKRVKHAVFGTGRVKDEEGRGSEARLTIEFPGIGRKKVLARFVKPL